MPSLRTSAIICGAIFGLIIILAAVGNLVPEPPARMLPTLRLGGEIVFSTLTVAFAFAAVSLMVNLVFGFLGASLPQVRVVVVWALWALMGLGTLVAVPAAIWFGAFGDVQGALLKRSLAHSQGTLVAGIGMSVPEIRRASSLPLGEEAGRYSTVSNDGIFDFRIAGSPTIFRHCRLYYMTLDAYHRIDSVHVSIVPEKMSAPELARFMAQTRARLRSDAWVAGRNENVFARGRTELMLGSARMDEWKPGDGADAGEWIATIDLDPRKS